MLYGINGSLLCAMQFCSGSAMYNSFGVLCTIVAVLCISISLVLCLKEIAKILIDISHLTHKETIKVH